MSSQKYNQTKLFILKN